MTAPRGTPCQVWAIGGGKGGTGKSFLTASLGQHLAIAGKRMVVVDADLAGANLHSFLGGQRPDRTLGDFLIRKKDLADLVVPSGCPNLSLVAGDMNLPTTTVRHFQKLKLFRQIRHLDAEIAILDLGAGSGGFNVDAFLAADRMIVVTTPEITSIENTYQFLKTALMRRLGAKISESGFGNVVNDLWQEGHSKGADTVQGIIQKLRNISERAARVCDCALAELKVYVVVNQTTNEEECQIGNDIRSVCQRLFCWHAEFAGFVRRDDRLRSVINNREMFTRSVIHATRVREISAVAEKLLGVSEAVGGGRRKCTTMTN